MLAINPTQRLLALAHFFRREFIPSGSFSAAFDLTRPNPLLQLGNEPVIWHFEGVWILAGDGAFFRPKLVPRFLDSFIVGTY